MTMGDPPGAAVPPDNDDSELSSSGSDDERQLSKTKPETLSAGSAIANATERIPSIEQLQTLLQTKETELRVLQKSHDEYVKSSCDYEKELETEIERVEKKSHSLEQLLAGLEASKVQLQATLTHAQHELTVSKKREDTLASHVQEMKWKIQRLEQTNDELETANRVALASVEELQHRVDTLTEENVFLLQEKEDAAAAAVAAVAVVAAQSHGQAAAESSEETKIEVETMISRRVSDATGPEPANNRRPNPLEKRRSARFPEVVESCLHMTCSDGKCRARGSHHLPIATREKTLTKSSGSGKEKTKKPFFEKLRRCFFRV